MPIKLIALDVDGTLMSSRNELLPSTVKALQDAADRGIHIVLSTGRMLSECRELLEQLPMIRYAVTCTGAQTIDLRDGSTIGRKSLTADDLLACKVPDDSVFIAANSVDVHGRFGPKSNEYVPIDGDYYGVPYRSLLPKGIDNLLLAGRCLSADSTAAGAVRVMPPCMAMGQAAGTAAALAVKAGVTPKQIDVTVLRETLKQNGVVL